MKRLLRPKQVIGMTDVVDFPDLGLANMQAKIDTGAYTSALHCKNVRLVRAGGQIRLSFCLVGPNAADEVTFLSDHFGQRLIRNSFGITEKRYVIKTRIVLFGRAIKTEFTLADRERMRYPVLLGRRLLRNRFVVDVALDNISYHKKIGGASPAPTAA